MKFNVNRQVYYFVTILSIAIAVIIYFPLKDSELSVSSTTIMEKVSPQTIPLSGTWQFTAEESNNKSIPHSALSLQPTKELPDLKNKQWQDINVPANWWLEGQDLSGVVWYRHSFKTASDLKNKVVKLAFAGVDYTADVWLNGHYLGFHEGYFQPFSFLIDKYLNSTKENVLIVRVNSPLEIQQQDWSLHKRLIKGVLAHHDARPGGAWSDRGQEQNTGGIWDTVALQVSEKIAIDRVLITPEIDFENNRGLAKVDLDINYPGDTEEDVAIELQLIPDNFADTPDKAIVEERKLKPGVNHLHFDLEKPNPRLWWTWEHGKPNLYRLGVNISQNNQLLDKTETQFGFRTIEYNQKDKIWLLNGKRMFIRGTNYIGSQWLSEMTEEKYSFDLALMKQANINAVRVHAHITAPDFYQLCDRTGMLVWQDFPLQWGYIESKEFEQEAISQGKDMIRLLYNHPAIMAWSLHNEPPWDADWMQYIFQNYDPKQNRKLNDKLFKSLKNSDPTRYLHLASTVNEHPWWGWYSNTWKKYGEPTPEPLITEFGAQALPNLSSLRRIFNEEELYPDNEKEWSKWAYHNFQKKETFEIAQVPMGQNTEEFIHNTQQYQAKLTKFAAEAYRRQRYQPVSAIFQFMFVENWASINWAVVDYWRNPKPGYEALKIGYQPVLPIISSEEDKDTWQLGETVKLDLTVVNDLWQSFPEAKVSYTLQHDWQHQLNEEKAIPIEPDSLNNLTTIEYQPTEIGDYELVAVIRDRNDKMLGQNTFKFNIENRS